MFIATSIDGFIARADGALDWLPEGGGEPHGYLEFMATVDALVIGRNHLYIDGGVTIQRFLAAGLIQRMIITRVPVVLGRGIPLFGPVEHDLRLTHVTTRAYPSGLVRSEYRVAA